MELAVLQSISLLCIIYSIIKGQFLSYHAYAVWEFKDPLSRQNVGGESVVSGFIILIPYIISPPRYDWHMFAMA